MARLKSKEAGHKEDPRIKMAQEATDHIIQNLGMNLDDVVYYATALKRGRICPEGQDAMLKIRRAAGHLCDRIVDMTPELAIGEIAYRASILARAKTSNQNGNEA